MADETDETAEELIKKVKSQVSRRDERKKGEIPAFVDGLEKIRKKREAKREHIE